jgi:3-oxoacid CoA-transferase subunit A
MINKLAVDAVAATAGVRSGDSVAIGGFGRAGIPYNLIDAICERDVTDLHVISNNAGKDDDGIARLVREHRVRKLTCTFPGTAEFLKQYLAGEVELELVPQGTLAERLRAGGSGIAAFYTPTAAGTILAEGGLTARYGPDGEPARLLPAKETRVIDGREYVLEYPLKPDVALVKADRADRYGNLRFRLSARNFNPLAAMAARTAIAEVREADPEAVLDPDDIHLPGPFVARLVVVAPRLDSIFVERGGVRVGSWREAGA